MREGKRKFSGILQIVAFALVFAISSLVITPMSEVFSLEDGFYVDHADIQTVNDSWRFGLIRASLDEKTASTSGASEGQSEVVFKLFGLLPVKRVKVKTGSEEEFYVGGSVIGLNLNSSGAIVVSGNDVLKEGDIIVKINGETLDGIGEIEDLVALDSASEGGVEVEFLRKGKALKAILKSSEVENGKLKLGLWVKDDVSGVGTLTFVGQDGSFGALGHAIAENGSVVPVSSGQVFQCNLIGIEKGQKNDPGQLRCVILPNTCKGEISENSKFGIHGTLNDVSGFVDENRTAKLGGRLGVKMGAAKIVSCVSGIAEEYDIEIIKTNYQKSADDKSLVFRVKDQRLLNLTGGIVQGMSGSPILQDGKIVGAVTHVFLNDPTKGYGVYVDWMI